MSRVQGKCKMRTVSLPIADDVIKAFENALCLKTPGLQNITVEGAISDALFLHFSKEVNFFLRKYVTEQKSFYPKQEQEPPLFTLGAPNE